MEALNGFGGSEEARLDDLRTTAGMKRWMRQTVRKHARGKPPANETAKAAAIALAQLLKDARKHA
jgi:hypothetical protein